MSEAIDRQAILGAVARGSRRVASVILDQVDVACTGPAIECDDHFARAILQAQVLLNELQRARARLKEDVSA